MFAPYSIPMIVKAIANNQLARFAPALYIRLTGQSGRGDIPGVALLLVTLRKENIDA